MSVWLSVVGIGEDGLDGLSPNAREAIKGAELLVGGARHLAMVPESGGERMAWPSPMSAGIDTIRERRASPVCVLATGDPMWCGIGATLAAHVPAGEMQVFASPSGLSLAAARLGWPEDDITAVSLHGRPAARLERYIHPCEHLLVLSEDGDTPREVAARLSRRGFGGSWLTVLEHLGGARERVREVAADQYDFGDVAPFNMVAVECVAGAGAEIRAVVPGLGDDVFSHDGQLTKREVRAITVARLMPLPGALLWDIGAGSGAISIEWVRAAPRARAIAIEERPERASLIRQNAEKLGVPEIGIIQAGAPAALSGLEAPDAVFIGGGLTREGGEKSVECALSALSPGGRLVANAVTIAGEALLQRLQMHHDGDLMRVQVSRAKLVGRQLGWHPMMPVTQWVLQRPWAAP